MTGILLIAFTAIFGLFIGEMLVKRHQQDQRYQKSFDIVMNSLNEFNKIEKERISKK